MRFEHRAYVQDEPLGSHDKPHGLWVSVDGEDDWPSWCLREEFWLQGLSFPHRVTLAPDARILHISTAHQLYAFHLHYCVETEFVLGLFPNSSQKYWSIDWRKVATDVQGIVIAPYLWSERLQGPQWYYGFDAASGCIWDTSAIESVEPRFLPMLEAKK
jgi:hypothetical protein